MKRTSLVSALAVTVLAACTAHGAIVGVATEVPINGAPEADGVPGYRAFQLSVEGDAGELISAIDIAINGPLHQRWGPDNDFNGLPDPTPNGPPANGRGDSHLTLLAGALIGAAPQEDNPGTGSPLANIGAFEYGVGSFMSGAWGIPGSSQSSSANLAYIIVPEDAFPQVSINVQVASDAGTVSLAADGRNFQPLGIPEPATVGLLGLGLLGLGIARRGR